VKSVGTPRAVIERRMRAVVVSLETIDFSIDSRRIKGKRGRGKESPGKARESSSTEIPRIRAFPRAAFLFDASPPYIYPPPPFHLFAYLSLSLPAPHPFLSGNERRPLIERRGNECCSPPPPEKTAPCGWTNDLIVFSLSFYSLQ